MRGPMLAGLSRRAVAALSRRAALFALGGAAIAPAALPLATARAGKAGKKARKRCKRQVGQCRAQWEESCNNNPACEASFFPCCERLERCDVTAYLTCVFAVD